MIRSRVMKRLIVLTIPACIVAAAFYARMPPKPYYSPSRPEGPAYSTQFSLTSLPAGWSQEFGLHSLTDELNLSGHLCWMGYRSTEVSTMRAPIVQRVLLQPGTPPKVQNFQLPAHDSSRIDLVGKPIFRANSDNCLLRVSLLDTDYYYYDVFHLNFQTTKAKRVEDAQLASYTFLSSPDGKSYACDSINPYTGEFYHLFAYVKGTKKLISQEHPSEGFSWTSDNHLLYSFYSPKRNPKQHYGYPNIYENDLKGKIKLIKAEGYRPLMNERKDKLAYFGPDKSAAKSLQEEEDRRFPPRLSRGMSIFVYDRQKKQDLFVKSIYEDYPIGARPVESYPTLFWIEDKLYIVQAYYTFSQQTAFCRLTEFNSTTRTLRQIGTLAQKGNSSDFYDLKFQPRFDFVGVAAKKQLLFQVPISEAGAENYRLFSVSIKDGIRKDLFAFTMPRFKNNLSAPDVAWIESGE